MKKEAEHREEILPAINCTGSVKEALVPVLLRITPHIGPRADCPFHRPAVDFERSMKQCMESVITFYQNVRYDNDSLYLLLLKRLFGDYLQ